MQASVALLAGLVAGGSAALWERSCATGQATPNWLGFNHLKFAFVFGDSYTATGFNFTKEPSPSPSNPLGNPAYPGQTSSNGENWIDLLTTKYNASTFLTFNLAVGGATVDSALVKPLVPTLSLKQQIEEEFLQGFSPALSTDSDNETDSNPSSISISSASASASAQPTLGPHTGRKHIFQKPLPNKVNSPLGHQQQAHDGLSLHFPLPKVPAAPGWTSFNSLFAIWIGINDVNGSFMRGQNATTALNKKILTAYAALVDELYGAGARNFLIVNVPAIDRSPGTIALGPAGAQLQKEDLAAFNALMADMAAELKRVRRDANVWTLETNTLFEQALDNVQSFPQTSGLKNTTEFCPQYAGGTPKPDTLIKKCGIPANQYFWLNGLHPTTAIHEVVAESAAQTLSAGPNVCAPSLVGGLVDTLSSFVGNFWQCGLGLHGCSVDQDTQ